MLGKQNPGWLCCWLVVGCVCVCVCVCARTHTASIVWVCVSVESHRVENTKSFFLGIVIQLNSVFLIFFF